MDLATIKKAFDDDGFVILRGVLRGDDLADIDRELDRIYREVAPTLDPGEISYEDTPSKAIRSISRLLGNSHCFERLAHDERIHRLPEAIFPGVQMKLAAIGFFGKAARDGSTTPPHQDSAYGYWEPAHYLRVSIAIDAATRQNGVMICQKGSHKQGILEHQPSNTAGFSQALPEPVDTAKYPEVPICMEPGDVALHHGQTVHHSGPNTTDRSRRMLSFTFRNANAKQDPERVKVYRERTKALYGKSI